MAGWINGNKIGELWKEEDWVSCMYQMRFSTAVLPMQSKWPKLTKFKSILHKRFCQMSWCFFSHILFLAEDNSESKTGKVTKTKLDLLFICAEYRYVSYTPRLWSQLHRVCTYSLYKEETHETLATQHMLYSCSTVWSGYGYRTCTREWENEGVSGYWNYIICLLMTEERSKSSVHASWCYLPTETDSAFKQILIRCNYIDYSGNTANHHKDNKRIISLCICKNKIQ